MTADPAPRWPRPGWTQEAPPGAIVVRGAVVDDQTRCRHWRGPTDIVAFRFGCCDGWWPCHECHAESAGHPSRPWPESRQGEASVLCGACKSTMTAPQYVASGSMCPRCGAAFNPRCKPHWPVYFEV